MVGLKAGIVVSTMVKGLNVQAIFQSCVKIKIVAEMIIVAKKIVNQVLQESVVSISVSHTCVRPLLFGNESLANITPLNLPNLLDQK